MIPVPTPVPVGSRQIISFPETKFFYINILSGFKSGSETGSGTGNIMHSGSAEAKVKVPAVPVRHHKTEHTTSNYKPKNGVSFKTDPD